MLENFVKLNICTKSVKNKINQFKNNASFCLVLIVIFLSPSDFFFRPDATILQPRIKYDLITYNYDGVLKIYK